MQYNTEWNSISEEITFIFVWFLRFNFKFRTRICFIYSFLFFIFFFFFFFLLHVLGCRGFLSGGWTLSQSLWNWKVGPRAHESLSRLIIAGSLYLYDGRREVSRRRSSLFALPNDNNLLWRSERKKAEDVAFSRAVQRRARESQRPAERGGKEKR